MALNYITFFAAVLNLGIGFFVWRANPKKFANKGFALIATIIGIYVIINFFFQLEPNKFYLKLIFSSGAFAIVSLFIWPYSIINEKLGKRFLKILLLLYFSAVLASILAFYGDSLVKSVISPENVELGHLFPIYAIYLSLLVTSLLIYLVTVYKNLDPELKKRANYSFIGFFIFLTMVLIVSVIFPFLGNTKMAVLDSSSTIIFVGFTGYAIFARKLFDTKVIITEAASIIIGVVLFLLLISSQNSTDWVLRSIIFVISIYGSFLLVKSVRKEIEQREQVELLATQLQSANSKLKQVDAMKTEFISMASHELLTPISAIEGYLSMMLDEKMVKIDDPKAIQYMQSVYKSSKRLARLVADLLNVSRIEQGRMLVTKQETDLKMIIEEVIKELKFKAKEKDHKIMSQIRDGISTKIYADEDKIKEVIINITGNSIKYTKEGGKIGIGVDIWPTSEVEKRYGAMHSELKEHAKTSEGALQNIVNEKFAQIIGDKQIVVIVKDTGIGISPKDIGHLFQKFSRVGDWSTQEVQGTGLGLYISRALVEMHHGRIWVESEGEGKGSTFYFSLPTIESEEQEKKLDAEVPVAKDAKPLAKPAAAAN